MKGYIYSALGNSFIITNQIVNKENIIKFCEEQKVDGLIYYQKEENKMNIFNKDGSKASMCGNGIRTLAHHLSKKQNQSSFNINTDSGIKEIRIINHHPFSCQVNLGSPRLIKELYQLKSIEIRGKKIDINAIYLGNYHIVIIVDDINDLSYLERAKEIFVYEEFKGKCNINFCQIISYHSLKVKTYERGVGFTLSCGTGSAASCYIAHLLYNLSNRIEVISPLGKLKVLIENHTVYLEGESHFEREISII